jgi:type IV pilus assembly protein PilC
MGGELPEITRLMLSISSHFPIFFTLSGFVILSLVFIKLVYGKTEQYKKNSSLIILNIPLIGNLVKVHYQAQFCKLLYLLVCSEVPLLRSLSMLETIIQFYPYSKSFSVMVEGLKKGESFAKEMDQFKYIYGNLIYDPFTSLFIYATSIYSIFSKKYVNKLFRRKEVWKISSN